MGIREDIRQALKDGPQSIDDLMQLMPSADKNSLRTSLAQMANEGRLLRKSEDGKPIYALNAAWKKSIKKPLQYGQAAHTENPVAPAAKKPAKVETRPAAAETKLRKTAPKDAPRETAPSKPVVRSSSFAAALSNDNRLVLIFDAKLVEFTSSQTAEIANALARA